MSVRCKQCKAEFAPKRSWQVFCSKNCQQNFHWGLKLKANPPEQYTLFSVPDDHLTGRLKAFAQISTMSMRKRTHCGYCGMEITKGGQQGFCNVGCMKHFIFDRKRREYGNELLEELN